MATFTNSTQWTGSGTLTKQTGTVLTISTKDTYVDKDIKMTLGVRSGSISTAATGSSTINTATFNYNSDNGNFDITGSESLTGTSTVTVGTAGWIGTGTTGTLTGTATLAASVPMINIKANMSGTAKVTPDLQKITGTNAGNALSGTITKTKPSSGYYVSVQSIAASNTITASPSVEANGYGTTEHSIKQNSTLSVGANASAAWYLPITPGSISLSAPGTASITGLTYTYNNGVFNVTGNGSLSGTVTATVTEGYIKDNVTGNISGTASLSGVTIPKVGVTATLSGATSARKPSLSRTDTSATGATNVGSDDATTSAPDSGYFISVKSNANTASITAIPSVSTTGYGTPTSGQYTVDATGSATVGAAASDVYYIPITEGSATTPTTTITTNPTVTINSSTGLITATYNGSKSITPTVSEGWVKNGTAGTVSTTGTGTLQLTTKGATTYNVSTSDQTIAAGTYLTGVQTFRKVTTLNIDAANIKSGINVRVGDSGSATRIKNVTGTFTAASTVSTGQTAAGAGQILTGYSAWVDATEVKGTIPIKTSSNVTVDSSGNNITIPAGYYGTDVEVSLSAGSVTPSYYNYNLDTYFNSGTAADSTMSITPNYTSTAGYIGTNEEPISGTPIYYKIKTTTRTAGAGSVTLTAGNGNATFAVGSGDSASASNPSLAFATSAPSAGTYYTLTITGKGTVSGTGKGTVSTGTGWITAGSTTSNASASSSQDSNTATIYRYIMKSVPGSAVSGSIPSSTTPTSTTEYYEIQPKGYISIPAGYNPKERVIFANVADASGEARAASGYSLEISSISGSADVIAGEKTSNKYPIVANNISVTGTFKASTAGWFSTGSATDSDTDSVTVGYMPEAVIGGSVTGATATTTVAPGNVTIGAGADVSGKTKVAITPTTATTGITTYYIPIKATAAANSSGTTSAISGSGSATVSTAGYAPATLTGSISVSGTATAKTSAKDSSNYYIPLPTASGAWAAGTTVAAKAKPGITNTNSIATISSPSGTAGTDYWTLTPTIASSTAGTYTAKYNYSSSGQGWVPNSLALTDGTARSVSVTAEAGTAIYIPKATFETTGGVTTITEAGYLPVDTVITNLATVTPQFDGGELTNKSASATGTNATLETTNNSGISILTKGTAGRAAVLYNGAVNGYVNVADNTTASAAVASSTWDGTTYYLKNVTLPKDKTFAVTTSADTALDTTSDLDITNAAYRRVDITNAANGTILVANSGNTTVTSGSKTAGNATIAAYETSSSTSVTSQQIVTNGVWVTSTPTASGTYYGRVVLGSGNYSADSSASSNSTVTPKVNLHANATSTYGFTTTAPSGTNGTNFLTIDPDATATAWSVTPRANITTAGYLAIGNKSGTAVSNTPSIAAGTNYYVPIITPTLGGGGLTETTNTNEVTTTPVVTISSSGTFKTTTGYGVTTTKPGGTDGIAYLTIDGTGSVTTTGVATSNYSVTRDKLNYSNSAGVIAAHTNTEYGSTANKSGSKTVNITPTVTDSFAPLYIPITSVSFSGGTVTKTNYTGKPVITMATGSDTNMANITVGNKDTTNYPYYFKVKANTAALSGTTTVAATARTYNVGAGAIKAVSGGSAFGALSESPTVTVSAADEKSVYVGLKKATMTVTGTNTVSPSASVSGSNITLSDTDNGIKVTATGGGTASVTAIATTNAAGYAPASTQLGSATLSASSNTTTANKYISRVKLVPPSSGTRSFEIEVPNGSTTNFIVFRFTVDTSGNVTVDGIE